jgi:DNA-binding response OmpR family regulator
MPARKPRILNVSMTPALQKERAAVLAGAGCEVVPALDLLQVEGAFKKHGEFDLVIIGYVLPNGEKRRVMHAVRKYSGADTPILELYQHGTEPANEESDEELPAHEEPGVLLGKVRELLARKKKKRRAASD